MTFRQRSDGLCPRCAFDAEQLIERIELDGLSRDLQLITEFEAYYRKREEQRERLAALGEPLRTSPSITGVPLDANRPESPFARDPFWTETRTAS
jgi:hypothetical protein